MDLDDNAILKDVRKMDPLRRFVYYMRERYNVRVKRLCGDGAPWTNDPILRTFKFTNVRREWDRTSQFLIKEWYKPHRTDSRVGVSCAVARFIGRVDTLREIDTPCEYASWTSYAHHAKATMTRIKTRGDAVFTGAYVISGAGCATGELKHRHVMDRFLAPVAKSNILNHSHASAFTLHHELKAFEGWGHFMTQEVVLDCMFTHVLSRAKDRHDYAMPGPGARRGLARLQEMGMRENGRNYKQFPEKDAVSTMQNLAGVFRKRYASHPFFRDMTAHDVEFNLCEWDKYERALWGQGTPKANYTPRTTDR